MYIRMYNIILISAIHYTYRNTYVTTYVHIYVCKKLPGTNGYVYSLQGDTYVRTYVYYELFSMKLQYVRIYSTMYWKITALAVL